MKILHLLASNIFSGAENVACQIINIFSKDEQYESIYCSPDGKIRDSLNQKNIRFVALQKLTVKEVKKVIKQENPDVIHAHDMKASFIASIVCKKYPKIVLISHIHNNAYGSRKISLKSVGYLFTAKRMKHIFWVSESAKNGYIFKKCVAHKSSVLRNVLDIDYVQNKAKTDNNQYNYDIVYLGRLSYEKNPERILDVFQKVKTKCESATLAVIGEGNLKENMLKKSEELSLNNSVSFLGFMNNPLKVLKDAKIMIMTSRWEGLPMCALEASILGVPIVSTPTDGLKEIIKNDYNGYISDDDDILCEKIVEILSSEEKRKDLSNHQIAFSQEYNDIEKYKETILKAYTQKY